MKDLRSAGKSGAADKNSAPYVEADAARDVQDAVNKYSGRSESELMSELVNSRRNGSISDSMLNSVAERMAPMLTDAQRARLYEIMSKLK